MEKVISCKYGSLTFTTYGGTLLSAIINGQELLFLSQFSNHPQSPVRGGVPVCWPWFGVDARGRHGTVRNQIWDIIEIHESESSAIAILSTTHQDLKLTITFSLTNIFKVSLKTTNNGKTFPSFSAALHTYFKAGKIFSVTGLGSSYMDKVIQKPQNNQKTDIDFQTTVDRVYSIFDSQIAFSNIKMTPLNADSIVYWNPGKIAQEMADLQSPEGFVCIEAAVLERGDLQEGEVVEFGFEVQVE
ncbi:Glucose-6-phosphate 1-epimerase [Spironucleus salmonicida]|uniref:Aldose 1-epimerase n=1 Tax=Spironucleus salmonicida TaxID=348837 RepID=V6LNW2_9EUKA|nr:Glucose-6-phosphate 1-epimerase [Spironucleus salmonicida]|eukprot:EST45933.1 Aldose 1-epimerase [Spironucleus salmonicida]